jgi:hypothetical protein
LVPPFARAVIVETAGGMGGNMLIEGIDSTGAVVWSVLNPAASGPMRPVRISNDTRGLRLTAQGANAGARAVFELYL